MSLQKSHEERLSQIAYLTSFFTCPVVFPEYFNNEIKTIFLQKWFYTLSEHLPNGLLDIPVEIDELNSEEYLTVDDFDQYDDDEIIMLFQNCINLKDVFQTQYKNDAAKLLYIKAQTKAERAKHYPKDAKNSVETKNISLSNKNIGYILPNFPPEKQLEFFWKAISDAFDRLQMLNEPNITDAKLIFDKTWNTMFGTHSYRLSIDAMTVIGFYNGDECNWIIFDVSLSGSIVHCYPSLNKVENSICSAIDDLQGISRELIF